MARRHPMKFHAFRLNQHGLARLFGELEVRIMDIVWDLGQATVQDVVDNLGQDAHYKTTMTVMNRLVNKGFLERRKVSRAFVYVPQTNRTELVEQLSRQVLDGLIADFGPAVLAHFVDALASADKEQLAELAALVENKLAAEEESSKLKVESSRFQPSTFDLQPSTSDHA
ncbi:MAG: BlaI/MecI/CopY family transcriptional regulator [Chloroflexota bacterium]